MYYYHSRDIMCKDPFGAVETGRKVKFSVYVKNKIFVHNLYLVLTKDGEKSVFYKMEFAGHENGQSRFSIELSIDVAGLYWYSFSVITERQTLTLFRGARGRCSETSKTPYQLTVYDSAYQTPDFIKGGIIYHIFVDRFHRGEDPDVRFLKDGVLKPWDAEITLKDPDGVFRANDFYGGNFQGIIDKLDYLKTLHVDLLYLSPIFKSASNHRYDTGDYLQFDELLGTEDKFRELLAEAEKRGISVMLDGVFNHTGADSRYFNKFGNYPTLGAYQSKESPFYDWYRFIRFPDDYHCWWGVTVTPTVNKDNPTYRKFILGEDGVVERYLKMGVKGWRLDVVDELDIDFVDALRKRVKSVSDDALIIGEVWEDASNKISYSERRPYLLGAQLDGVMNYPFKNAIITYLQNGDPVEFSEQIMTIIENYPKQALAVCMNLVDTHDTWRILNVAADLEVGHLDKEGRSRVTLNAEQMEAAKQRMKIAAVLQFTLPGVPSIYYGDEAGLDGYEDPLNRKPMPWQHFNKDIFAFYQRLTAFRAKYRNILQEGVVRFFLHENLLAYRVGEGAHMLLVFVNHSPTPQEMILDADYTDLISGKHYKKGVHLCPQQAFHIFEQKA